VDTTGNKLHDLSTKSVGISLDFLGGLPDCHRSSNRANSITLGDLESLVLEYPAKAAQAARDKIIGIAISLFNWFSFAY
jgi:hypothetical protein